MRFGDLLFLVESITTQLVDPCYWLLSLICLFLKKLLDSRLEYHGQDAGLRAGLVFHPWPFHRVLLCKVGCSSCSVGVRASLQWSSWPFVWNLHLAWSPPRLAVAAPYSPGSQNNTIFFPPVPTYMFCSLAEMGSYLPVFFLFCFFYNGEFPICTEVVEDVISPRSCHPA